jgi:Rad3-related DNA helicase
MEAAFGAGYAYAYLYPGIQKVIQAAGRVIRSEHDRGVVYLLDDRYGREDVRRLLPQWWAVEAVVLPGVAEAQPGSRPSLPRTAVRSRQRAPQQPAIKL